MTSASFTEDRYGVVQRDIPKILEALISFLSAVEQYQTELGAQSQALPATASTKEVEDQKTRLVEIMRAKEILGRVGDCACQLTLSRIAYNTDTDSLSIMVFRFEGGHPADYYDVW